MKVEDIVQNIYNANWVLSDEFEIEIDNPGEIKQEVWNMCVVSFSMPELSSAVGSSVLGGIRKLTSRMYDTFIINITFRDIGHTKLRKYFERKFALQQKMYYDQISTKIGLFHIDSSEGSRRKLFSAEALITNISGLTFNNAESNIQEFTVSFSTGSFSTDELLNFGTSEFEIEVIDNLNND